MKHYFNTDTVVLDRKAGSWEEAISIASKPLIENGTITESYIFNMIDSVHKNGPYIVLNDYFALAHAKAGEGVNKVGVSFLRLNEEVDMKGKPVRIIIVLAAVDRNSHLDIMSSIAEVLTEEKKFKSMFSGTKEEIIYLFGGI